MWKFTCPVSRIISLDICQILQASKNILEIYIYVSHHRSSVKYKKLRSPMRYACLLHDR